MPHVPGLRSPYAQVGRLVYVGRMFDKIRLHAAGRLPAAYHANLGETRFALFDARCCRFLGVAYTALRERVLVDSDAEALAWAHAHGTLRTDEECATWNRFMTKIGWRDDRSAALGERVAEFGLAGKPIETFFDLLDIDEGRDPVARRAWELRPACVVVLMGVAGSGKTTVGRQLADALGCPFNDADEFHPAANIEKMAAGTPLDDDDRAPWLAAIRAHIDHCLRRDETAVVTCSALKERYRAALVSDPARVKLVYLQGSRELLEQRLAGRAGHFMKPQMLASQLAALEEPAHALTADIALPPATLVAQIRQTLTL